MDTFFLAHQCSYTLAKQGMLLFVTNANLSPAGHTLLRHWVNAEPKKNTLNIRVSSGEAAHLRYRIEP